MQYLLFYVLLSIFPVLAFASDDPTADIPNNVNITFYHIDVEVGLDEAYITGKTYCEFIASKDNIKSFQLDLVDDLKVSKIEGAASFEHNANQLFIELEGEALKKGDRGKIKIFYEGVPPTIQGEKGLKKGLIYSTHGKKDNPVIASVCYPSAAYLWFPCKKGLSEKADSLYVDITIEDRKVKEVYLDPKSKEEVVREMPIIAVSNGSLEDVITSEDGKKTFQWRHRHSILPHHTMFAVSNFMKAESEYKGKGHRFPIDFYFLPENFKESSAMMRRVPEIMDCLTNTFGPYPYKSERFSVTQVGIPLGVDGMPTQTNVLLEDMKAVHMYKVVHQMASMWFGNRISPSNWQDAWITEALATYAEAMWQEYKRGLTVYQIILDEKEYFDGGKLYLDTRTEYSEERLSKKGFYAIHMLRGIMSDAYFFQTLKAITAGKQLRGNWKKNYLSTENFQQICEYYASENIERDYTYFFDQWIKGEFYPTYEVTYSTNGNKVTLNVNQTTLTTTPNVFNMPYRVQAILDDGTVANKIINEEQDGEQSGKANQTFELEFDRSVERLEFDPANWIFKDLKYVRKLSNEKLNLENFEISTSGYRRKITVNYNVPKKQDITIQLVRVADGVSLLEDEQVALEEFKKEFGEQSHQFKIPLALTARGVFRIDVICKGATYSKVLRLKRVKKAF